MGQLPAPLYCRVAVSRKRRASGDLVLGGTTQGRAIAVGKVAITPVLVGRIDRCRFCPLCLRHHHLPQTVDTLRKSGLSGYGSAGRNGLPPGRWKGISPGVHAEYPLLDWLLDRLRDDRLELCQLLHSYLSPISYLRAGQCGTPGGAMDLDRSKFSAYLRHPRYFYHLLFLFRNCGSSVQHLVFRFALYSRRGPAQPDRICGYFALLLLGSLLMADEGSLLLSGAFHYLGGAFADPGCVLEGT